MDVIAQHRSAAQLRHNGGAIVQLTLSGTDVRLAPQRPVGPDALVVGGWQTMFPNAGAAAVWAGRQHPPHGIAFNGPWSSAGQGLSIESADLRLDRRRAIGKREFAITDTITTTGPDAVFQYGHHIAFDAGRKPIVASGSTVLEFEDEGLGERLEILPATGAATITRDELVVTVLWDPAVLPWLWLWYLGGPSPILSLEPCSSDTFDGLAAAAAQGRATRIRSGQEVETSVRLTLDDTPSTL